MAAEWAERLDREEFSSLLEMMRPDCEYRSPGGVLVGPVAIADSYRKNAEWAHRTFEHIEWSSELADEEDGRIRITFEDRTLHQGIRHAYRCRQILTFDSAGLISHIEHVAIASEEAALADFFRRIGVER